MAGIELRQQAEERHINGEAWWRQHRDCFSSTDTGDFTMLKGTINSQKYYEISENRLCNSGRRLSMGRHCVFQQDNDPKQTSRQTTEWPNRNGVTVDLDQIENLWKELKINVAERLSSNLGDLDRICIEEWGEFPNNAYRNYVS